MARWTRAFHFSRRHSASAFAPGIGRATEIILTGESWKAAKAATAGFINRGDPTLKFEVEQRRGLTSVASWCTAGWNRNHPPPGTSSMDGLDEPKRTQILHHFVVAYFAFRRDDHDLIKAISYQVYPGLDSCIPAVAGLRIDHKLSPWVGA